MNDTLHRLLENKLCLIADGGMGTSLFAAGLETGGSPELWNVEHPDRVQAIHAGFIEAGADIILTNTFGGTRYRLKLHQMDDRVDELNQAATRVAHAAADAAGRPVVVAGDMGPTGELFEPLGILTRALGIDAFTEQARALAAGGADILWIETMSSCEEVEAAALGAAATGLPVVCTLTFDTAGRTMMGMTPEDAAVFCQGLDVSPVAFGANCGNGPAELVNAMTRLAAAARADAVLIAKSNCGIPDFIDGQVCYDGTPEIMAVYARMARDAGARIIGGCCGSTPEHLRAMVSALAGYTPQAMPDIAAIEARLGPLAAAAKPGGVAAADLDGSREAPRVGLHLAAGSRPRIADGPFPGVYIDALEQPRHGVGVGRREGLGGRPVVGLEYDQAAGHGLAVLAEIRPGEFHRGGMGLKVFEVRLAVLHAQGQAVGFVDTGNGEIHAAFSKQGVIY